MDSERRCAVTMISSSPDDEDVSAAVAAQAVPALPLRIAAIAQASFGFVFKSLSLNGQMKKLVFGRATARRPDDNPKKVSIVPSRPGWAVFKAPLRSNLASYDDQNMTLPAPRAGE